MYRSVPAERQSRPRNATGDRPPLAIALRRGICGLAACFAATAALAVKPGFRVHADEFALEPLETVRAGLRFENVPLASLTAAGTTSGSALVGRSTWDFRPARLLAGATDSIAQVVPASAAWSCYLPDTIACGFGATDVDALGVEDSLVAGVPSRDAASGGYDPATGILRGRATVSSEGNATTELRVCLGTGASAPLLPAAVFANVEPGSRRSMRAGDPAWQSPVFNCVEAATYGAPCRAAGGQKASLASRPGVTEGRVRGRVAGAGTITLPSGHVLDALLLEGFTSYTARAPGVPCFLDVLTVRQWRLSWVVPHVGALVSLSSPQDTAQLSAFTTAASTFIGHGLLPPLSMRATSVTPDAVTVAWDPGLLGERFIDGYEVHWGPGSQADQAPAFHSGPIPSGTTSYRIQGLAPEQAIRVSVTSFRSYADPVSGLTTRYGSVGLPVRIGADTNGDGQDDHSYPPEVVVTTAPAGPCVAGDLDGDGAFAQGDLDAAMALLVGPSPPTPGELACVDWAPGAPTCAPPDQPARWCASPDGALRASDLVALLAQAAGRLTLACSGCP